MPEAFHGPELFAGAWGIWYGETAQSVALCFVLEATRRVRETYWHPSQRLEALLDGGCILRETVDAPMEMVHWIRGWGPQVEVLEPGRLRKRMVEEAREVVRKYEESYAQESR